MSERSTTSPSRRPVFASTVEVGKLLHLSEDEVYRRIRDKRLSAVRCGRLWRIRVDQLLAGEGKP